MQTNQLTKASEHQSTNYIFSKSSNPAKENTVNINSRFGTVCVNREKSINFEHGILGAPGNLNFVLTDLPGHEQSNFKLFQSLEDESFSFIVVPSQYDNQLIEEEDLDPALKVLEIENDNLVLLFIVTVQEGKNDAERPTLSVNAKAPLMVDVATMKGNQYVLQSDKYSIKHVIS